MLLGDVIASFEDPVVAGEVLVMVGDLGLVARIHTAAAEAGMVPGEFARQSVARFVDTASEEEWLTLLGLMSRADNPGQVFLRRVLAQGIAEAAAL